MPATFSTKVTSVPAEFFKRAGQLASGAATEYFESAMPMSTSTLKEATSSISTTTRTLTNTTQSILPQLKSMKLQTGLRSVMTWFNGAEDSFGNYSSDLDLTFDTETSSGEETQAQISELENVSNTVSKAIVESDKHLMEGNMQLAANVVTSIDKQTAVISAGFDRTNETLGKILEVMTKNTATLIELNKVAKSENKMASSGKFNLNDYKKMVQGNIKNNPSLGMMSAFLPMLADPNMMKMMVTPENIASMMFSGFVNKKAPNLKKNMQALDDAINDAIMNSLVRIGEKKNNKILSLFGIDSTGKDYSNNRRSSLDLKATPFDTVTKESITQAIPGYLRKILVQLGGEDVIYDNRTRSWRKGSALQKDFLKQTTNTGGLSSASSRLKNSFGNDQLGSMIYDLMMTDLGHKQSKFDSSRNQSSARTQVSLFSDPKEFVKYVSKELYQARDKNEEKYIEAIAKRLAMDGRNFVDISNTVARNNINRTKRVDSYLSNADAYGVDVSKLSSDLKSEMNHILQENGIGVSTLKAKSTSLSGVEYSNRALFEIYRLLDRGINVFQVGSTNTRSKPYKRFNQKHLQAPSTYRAKELQVDAVTPGRSLVSSGSTFAEDTDNLLRNNTLDDGTSENLSRGERLGRWGSNKASALGKAMFSGSPEQVKEVFGSAVSDITGIMGDAVKDQAKKISDSYGNISGYIQHTFLGTGYSYKNEKGQTVEVKANEKGGMLGFVKDYFKDRFDNAKKSSTKWFDSVKSYFNTGNKDESQDIKNKRKSLMSASVGAFAGAGILGGPLGLIVGGLAGSALSGLDVGSKIKDLLFGRKDGKATGLITKAFDGFIDPIRYQFQKTLNVAKSVLKEKVLGPISDIGVAIKERIASIMDNTVGKAFKFIGNVLIAPFKLISKAKNFARRTVANVAGGVTRGGLRAGGVIADTGLGAIGNLIAGNTEHTYVDENGETQTTSTREWIKMRRKERKSTYKNDTKFDDYSTWKNKEEARRAEWDEKLHDYLKEDTKIIEEMNETNKNVGSDVHVLAELGSEKGSIFTHDDGLHTRLDTIINLLSHKGSSNDIIDLDDSQYTIDGVTGAKISLEEKAAKESSGQSDNDNADSYANAALGAAASIITEGNITNKDKMTFNKLYKEVGKRGSSREQVGAMLNDLLISQEDDLQTSNDNTKSWWQTLLDNFGKILPVVGAGGALLTFLSNFNLSDISNMIKNISDGIGNGIKLLFSGGDDEDPVTDNDAQTAGTNAVLGLVDAKVENQWDLVRPFSTIYHRDNDAAGNGIANKAVTEDKNWLQVGLPLLTTTRNSAIYNANVQTANAQVGTAKSNAYAQYSSLREQGYSPAEINSMKNEHSSGYDSSMKSYKDAKTNLAETENNSPSVSKNVGSNIAKNTAKMGIGTGISMLMGKGIGLVADNIVSNITGNEELGDQAGQYAQYTGSAITSAGLMLNEAKSAMTGKASICDTVLSWVKKLFDATIGRLKSVKSLQGKLSKVTSFIDDLYNKTAGKLTQKVAEKIAARVDIILGKQVGTTSVAAATAGLSIAVGGIVGGISGACSAENLFQVPAGQADALMTTISTLMEGLISALEWTPGVGIFVSVLDLLDDLVFKGITGKSFVQGLAETIYDSLGDRKTRLELQGKMTASKEEYEETFNTSLNESAWNDLVNSSGLLDTILHGKAKTKEDGTIDISATFNEDGSRKEGGLIGAGKKIGSAASSAWNATTTWASNTASSISTGVKDTWNNAKTWVSDTKDSIFNTAANTLNSIGKGISGVGTSIGSALSYIKDNITDMPNSAIKYVMGDTESVEFDTDSSNPGSPIISLLGKSAAFMLSPARSIVSVGKGIGSLFGGIKDIGSDVLKSVKSYIKGDTDDISISLSKDSVMYNIMSPLTKVLQAVLSPVRIISKAFKHVGDLLGTSSEDGGSILDSIKNGASNIWSTLTGGTGGSTNKSIDIPPISNGVIQIPGISTLMNMFGLGGPLSKNAVVTSDYGNRTYPFAGKHEGVDLAPADGSGKADVQSNVIGTVSYVKNNVPNSDTAKLGSGGYSYNGSNSGGNMVWIDTPDGYRIKNMHLKAGSIPNGLQRGSVVSVGDKIGEVGSTGWSTGQHLHYQVEKDGVAVNPMYGTGGFMDSITNLTTIGSNIISKITGGIFSSSSNNSSSSSDSSSSSFSSSYLSTDGASATKVVQIALNEVGTAETGNNNVKYNTWYYGHTVNGDSYPWCMVFVQWCFNEAGTPLSIRSAGVKDFYARYKASNPNNIISNTGTAQPGDIFIKYRSGGGHTGIVVSDEGDSVTTVEGNTSGSSGGSDWNGGSVQKKTRKKSEIVAFIRPREIASSSIGTNVESSLKNGESKDVPVSGLGKSKPYMGWQCINSKSSDQYKLRADAGQNFDSQGFGKINNRYVVAMKQYWGNVGDYVDVTLDNGEVIKGIIGDIKSNENDGVSFATYAHGTTAEDSSVVEFVVDKNSWYGTDKAVVKYHPEFNSTVKSVANRGNYWTTATGGSTTRLNVPYIYSNKHGVGGSTIGNNTYSTNRIRPTSNYGVGSSTYSLPVRNNPFITTRYAGTGGENSSSTDISRIVALLGDVVSELIQIGNNTYSSSNYLSSINDKDFVDSGLRDSIKAVNKIKASQSSTKANTSSASSVASIASP